MVARNVRFYRKVVGLVILLDNLVAFVEANDRRWQAYGTPAKAVMWKMRREIESVTRWRIRRHGSPELCYRFDVLGIRPDSHGQFTVDHLEDACHQARTPALSRPRRLAPYRARPLAAHLLPRSPPDPPS